MTYPLITRCLLLSLSVLLASCSAGETKRGAEVGSPGGWAAAYVLEWDSNNTQVIVSFNQGKCERGAVSARGVNLGLRLSWVDSTTLEVAHPENVVLTRTPDSEFLQCGSPDRRVHVVLAARRNEANNRLDFARPTRNGGAPLLAAQPSR